MSNFIPYDIIQSVLSIETFLAFISLSFIAVYFYLTISKNLPPGPIGLPILGYSPFLSQFPPNEFEKLGKKYGPIFSLNLGSKLTVVINSYDLLYEAYIKQADKFSLRPYEYALACDIKGYIARENPTWRVHRGLAMKYLKDFGVGKIDMELRILDEVTNLVAELEKYEGEPTNITRILSVSMANIVCKATFGTSHTSDDKQFLDFIKLYDEKYWHIKTMAAWAYFPWLIKIPGVARILGLATLRKVETQILSTIRKHIKRIKATHQPGSTETFINSYLTEIEVKNSGQPDDLLNETHLSMILDVMFEGGSETAKTWIMWSIMNMMLYPDVQRKVQEEIDRTIGKDRYPQFSDKFRTPYTEATIFEVGRLNTLVPVNLSRENSKSATLSGYNIPQQTLIISNLWYVHHDPKLWGDPEVFRPERFLSETGELKIPQFYIPFSIGKLNCFGENLARIELYLYFTTLMQKFKWETPVGETLSHEGRLGLTYVPNPYKANFRRRK